MRFIFSIFLWVSLSQLAALAKPGSIIPGQFVVTLDPNVVPEEVLRDHQLHVQFIYRAALNGFAGKISDVAQSNLLDDRRVLRIEQDRVVTANASQLYATWGLDRIDQRVPELDLIYSYNYTGNTVTAYVLDTGIRYEHQEFLGRVSLGFDAYGGDGSDCNGHGTHVAGTIGGTTYGVAKQVRLVSVRVLDCTGNGSTSSVLAGIDWVRQNRQLPAVANLSLGGAVSSTLDTGVSNMIAAGVATAVAAGDDNSDACNSSPARVASAMTVGATDATDVRAALSNWGPCLDWFAPGMSITSANYVDSTGSIVYSGTSMAAAHAAGAAALYLQQYPAATPAEVHTAFYNSASRSIVTSANSNNNHLLFVSLSFVAPPPPPTVDTSAPTVVITAPAQGSKVARRQSTTITTAASDNVKVTQVEVRVNGNIQCTLMNAPYNCIWKVPPQSNRSYAIQSKAYDAAGNSSLSAVITVSSQ